jgi:hypothetical protein
VGHRTNGLQTSPAYTIERRQIVRVCLVYDSLDEIVCVRFGEVVEQKTERRTARSAEHHWIGARLLACEDASDATCEVLFNRFTDATMCFALPTL